MAQDKKTGKTPAKKSGKAPAKKSGSSASKSKNSKVTSLDSVRGGAQRQSSRGQEAARRAAGRETGTALQRTDKAPAKKNTSPAVSGGKKKLSAADARLWQRMAVIALVVMTLVFLAIQAVSCANSQVASRQTVMVTLSDNIETTGIAIRNERIITSDQYGVIVSAIENGGKVSKGETVANVYNSTDAARAHIRMAEIEEALEQFSSMATAGEDSAAEVKALEKSIRNELMDLSELIYRGDVGAASETSDDLLYLLNKTQVATRVVENFSAKTVELENELKDLQARYPDQPGQLKSPLSGYYISSADGYENLLSSEICPSLTPEKLEEITKLRNEPDNSMIVGKIADDYIWYMACEVSAEDADRLAKKDGEYVWKDYTLYLAYSELDSITAKLVGVNTGADNSRRVLIFECSYMVSELSTVRVQPVTIELSSYSGLEINTGSITTREVTVPASDIKDWDMEGREALARELCPTLFAHEGVSGSDVEPAPVDENNPYSVAANKLIHDTRSEMSEILKGIKLPEKITYTQQGVFVVWGNEIKFKRIVPVYQTGDKLLCAYNLSDSCLKMYDKVVDNPKEVYDGQIVNNAG